LEKAFKKYPNTKAVIVANLYGTPAKMKDLKAICDKHNSILIEDAAESLGATIDGQQTGTFGDYGVISFNGNKIITSSGGGALFSNDEEAIKNSRFLATQARDDAPHYQHSEIGYNYRMSNIVAGIGRAQLEAIDKRVEQRRNVFNFYKTLLEKFDFISFIHENENNFSNRWLTTITFDFSKIDGLSIKKVMEVFEKNNIETRPLWKPMHLQPIFENCPSEINGVSEKLFNKGLCLPSGSNLTKEEIQSVIAVLKDF
jgi:dTDP-4-amino-4,6-dideoxygalactose transaminase